MHILHTERADVRPQEVIDSEVKSTKKPHRDGFIMGAYNKTPQKDGTFLIKRRCSCGCGREDTVIVPY